MLVNLDQILERGKVDLHDTVYSKDEPYVRQFMMSAGDFFEIVCDRTEYKAYESLFNQKRDGELSIPEDELDQYRKSLSKIKQRLKELKTEEEDLTHAHADEIKKLRQERRRLNTLLGSQTQQNEKLMIKFKNCLIASSFQTVKRCIPQLNSVHFRNVEQIPLFVKNLPTLAEACRNGREVAITGGPCLFGVNEVLVNVYYRSYGMYTYDFSTGRYFAQVDNQRDLAEDLALYSNDVEKIEFVNQKQNATSQEYDSIHCLFEYARALKSKLTIPLPDMSYIKFLKNIVEPLRKEVADDAVEKFRLEAYKISDIYLAVIDEMKARYPEVVYAVIHERDPEMMRLYYENRKPFLTPSIVKKLTAVRGKTDAVLDYITMPALPYYIWGIQDIIQMDCLDETDSYRKAIKIHKGKVRIYAMLYPERISGDGENTIFYAPIQYKEYLTGQMR